MRKKTGSIIGQLKIRVRDAVGVDLGASGTKVVRLKRDRTGKTTLMAAELLPPLLPPDSEDAIPAATLHLPRALQAPAAALCYASVHATCKLLALQGGGDKINDHTLNDLLGLPRDADYRFRQKLIPAENRIEVQVLAVAVPMREARWLASLFARGKIAPCSAQIAGLAAANSFLEDPGREQRNPGGPELVIDAGERVTTLVLFDNERPLVVRQFVTGVRKILQQVTSDLRVDEETARDILDVGSIDIRASLQMVYEDFLRQLAIAVDFSERRVGRPLSHVSISGGLSGNRDWRAALREITGIEPRLWNPWEGMHLAPGAVSEQAARPGHCFAAATGAALSILESA